jgi:hypothetical protein
MTIAQVPEASTGPQFINDGDHTGPPLLKGSECRHLPNGSAVVMVVDSSGKKVHATFPSQSRWDNRWTGAPWQDDRLDPSATYRLLHPKLVDLWLVHRASLDDWGTETDG